MIGQTISHYKILEHLGAGGMGTVYKAEDTRLHRHVALKLLPEDITVSPADRKRLAREAESAAQLSHPNIATVYDFDEFDDAQTKTRRAFIAMEYVQGDSLKKKIADRPMSFEDTTSILIQVARALQSAHQHGIVHRDVKPANIVLTADGTAKLLDFGIAKRSGETRVTKQGEISGSIAYMSPEQLRDERIDARTDIWALGVVAFEMLTQKKPFRGEHPAALMYCITNEEPLDILALRSNIPEPLKALCRRCLQKDPDKRPASMDEVLTLLRAEPTRFFGSSLASPLRSRRWKRSALFASPFVLIVALMLLFPSIPASVLESVGIGRAPGGTRIAVLRFGGIGPDSTLQTLCDGITEMMISGLRQILRSAPDSYVYSSSDVYNPNYKVATVNDARMMFGVTHVVQGTILTKQKLLTLKLIDAADGQQIQASIIPYTRLSDPQLQGAILSALAKILHRSLKPEAIRTFTLGMSSDTAATGWYRQGLGYMHRFEDPDNLEAAIIDFRIAIDRDSAFALAHSALGSAYLLKYRLTKESRWLDDARASCDRAIILVKDLPEPYVTLGTIHLFANQVDEAMNDLRHALALDETNADARIAIARTYNSMGHATDAERWFRDAIRIRSDSWVGYNALGAFYYRNRRLQEAAVQFRLGADRAPDNYWIYNNLGSVYLDLDSVAQAIPILERSVKLRPDYGNLSNLGTAHWRLGQYDEDARNLEKAIAYRSNDYRLYGNLAEAYRMIPGSALEMENSAKRAIQYAEDERESDPRNPEVLADLAGYHAMLNHKTEAIALLKTARARGEKNPVVLGAVAQTYEELGERARALEVLGEAFRYDYSPREFERTPRMKNLIQDPKYAKIKDRFSKKTP